MLMIYKEIGIITKSYSIFKYSLNDISSRVIYAGTDTSLKNPLLEEWTEDDEVAFILGGQHDILRYNVKTIPMADPEGQDYIACSDIALIKLGYGSVSEAIRSHVPIIGVDFAQTAETIFMKKLVENLGMGICITTEEFFQGEWKNYISEVLDMKQNFSLLPERFVKHGESQIASIILDLLEEIT